MNLTITIALLATMLIFIIIHLWRMIRFTKQKVVDSLRLNKLFGMPRAIDLSYDELKKRVTRIAWKKLKPNQSITRNGWIIKEIHPVSAKEGYIYITVVRDNRPRMNQCHVCIACDIAALDFKATLVPQSLRDYEYMIYLLGLPERETMEELRAINAGLERARESVRDRYILLAMREVL